MCLKESETSDKQTTMRYTKTILVHFINSHRKCTVAAAYNLSVHKLQEIILQNKYMGYFCQAITP